MKLIAPDIINDILEALDRQIGVHGGVPLGLVVCGGTALSALGLVMRTTRDMDVLGSVSETREWGNHSKYQEVSGMARGGGR